MTKGEAKCLETDVVIFPMESNRENQTEISAEAISTELIADKPSIRTDIQIRFVRLKKSLRKRSASIL